MPKLPTFAFKTTGTASGGAVLTEGGFTLDTPGISPSNPQYVKDEKLAEAIGGALGGLFGCCKSDKGFQRAIENKLTERSLYDDPIDGDRHYKAKRVAARLGITVLEYYDFMIAEKQERLNIAAEQGVFHADSAHDLSCYTAMKAAYIAGK